MAHLSALQNVMLPLELLGHPRGEARAEAEALLDRLQLSARATHLPHALSGGEQQRVAIARAFIHRPALILADEPTGNLDPETSEEVLTTLLELQENRRGALLLITHEAVIADRLSAHIELRGGHLVERRKMKRASLIQGMGGGVRGTR